MWYKFFGKESALNLGVPGDRTQHVLWRISNIELPRSLQYALVQTGTSNSDHDSARDIAHGVLSIGCQLLEKVHGLKVILSGILPRNDKGPLMRDKIVTTNKFISECCTQKSNMSFIDHQKEWITSDGELKRDLFFIDNIHLVERGNIK